MTRKTITIDDTIHLSYLDLGQGEPLLFIHGFTGTALGDLGEVIAAFATDHRAIAPDLRG